MIGNDIVDLALAKKQSNWRRKGYLEKIFTQQEQHLINNTQNPNLMVWNLWSRKEAAYKIYNRETGIRAFIPLKLECSYESENIGTVSCRGFEYFTKTVLSEDFVYTISVSQQDFFNKIAAIVIEDKINKINGIPFLENQNSSFKSVVSITHHGRFWRGIALQLKY